MTYEALGTTIHAGLDRLTANIDHVKGETETRLRFAVEARLRDALPNFQVSASRIAHHDGTEVRERFVLCLTVMATNEYIPGIRVLSIKILDGKVQSWIFQDKATLVANHGIVLQSSETRGPNVIFDKNSGSSGKDLNLDETILLAVAQACESFDFVGSPTGAAGVIARAHDRTAELVELM